MEKEKIIYFEKEENIKSINGDEKVIDSYNILIEIVDGPFKSLHTIGSVGVEYDKTLRVATVYKIEIGEAYECLDIIPKIIDLTCDIYKSFGSKSIHFTDVDDADMNISTPLFNKGFKPLREAVDADDIYPTYYKDIRNLL